MKVVDGYDDDDGGGDAEFEADDDEIVTIPCPHCREPIWEEAVACPHCRAFLSEEDRPWWRPWWMIVGAAACLYCVYRWIVRR